MEKIYTVAPQVPICTEFIVEKCKNCGKPIFIPADREPLVLGYLCGSECEAENDAFYDRYLEYV